MTSSLTIELNPSEQRGHADHGWLNAYHTFSFGDWFNPDRNFYSSLRVINEDRVAGGGGFPMHGHRDFEIFTYILSGKLRHRDSLGNEEVIGRGGIQFTSAGSGVRHSEFNAAELGGEDVHLLQVWLKPVAKGLKPSYTNKEFPEVGKINQLKLLLSPDGQSDSVRLNQDAFIYASILEGGHIVKRPLGEGRKAYVHLAMNGGSLRLNGRELRPGDGAFISGTGELEFHGNEDRAEFLLFDLAE